MNEPIEKRLERIEDRNRRVDADKAWETSLSRKIYIALVTYFFAGLYFTWLTVNRPWLNAFVPTFGFLFSTLVLKKAKDFWLSKRH